MYEFLLNDILKHPLIVTVLKLRIWMFQDFEIDQQQ
jgi:hypothetical protein